MRKISHFLLLFIVILASGCPQNAPKLDFNNDNFKNLLSEQLRENVYKKDWIEYNCAKFGFFNEGITNNTNSFTNFNCGNDVNSLPLKGESYAVNVRNHVLSNGIGMIDSAYDIYIRNIRRNRSVGEFLADLVATGGSTAVGIAKGTRPLQIIGVALTGFSAGRKSANLNFYDEKTTSVLIKQMDASRSQILGEIKQEQRKSTNEYSFDDALVDLVRYFDVGTLNRAFSDLDRQASTQSENNRKAVVQIKGLQDINSFSTNEESKNTSDVRIMLNKIHSDLQDKNKVESATGILKSVYNQIVEEKKFDALLADLKAKNGGYDQLSKRAAVAVDNFFTNPNPTGEDYFQLIQAILSMTNVQTDAGLIDKPDLRKLLLEYFNKAK